MEKFCRAASIGLIGFLGHWKEKKHKLKMTVWNQGGAISGTVDSGFTRFRNCEFRKSCIRVDNYRYCHEKTTHQIHGLHAHRAALDHFNHHPDLIQGIKAELGGKSLRWRLADLEYRLLFVPEKRAEYAALYESYCKDVINDLLEMTNLENPFNDLRTLTGAEPDISENHGLNAFLVHNLVKEFSGTYIV